MDLLIVLIPVLPIVGFLFTVLVGSRLDHVPVHGHAGTGHEHPEHEASHAAEGHGAHDGHAAVDESGFHSVPTEEEQARTSPHAGHADDLANSNGADGVIPPDLSDGRGQAGHVVPGGPRPVYRSWWLPTPWWGSPGSWP